MKKLKKITNNYLYNRTTRLLPVLLLLAGTALAACGGRADTAGPPPSATESGAETAPAGGETQSGNGSGNSTSETILPPEIADAEFGNRILIVDGKMYYGTPEIGPMGDAGAVDGNISSSVSPDAIPYDEGQSNFGCEGNPYTWDYGDGTIMVLSEDEEWHIFERRIEPNPSGPFCAYVKMIDEDKLYADMAEWITPEDTERILELGLKERDLADGYHIYNQSLSRVSMLLTDSTVYRYINRNGNSAVPGQNTGFLTETSDKEEFIRYFETYADSNPDMLFSIEAENGIIKVIEELPVA